MKKIAKLIFPASLLVVMLLSGCKSSSKNPTAPVIPTLNSTKWMTNATSPVVSPDGSRFLYKWNGAWYLYDNVTNTHILSGAPQPSSAIKWFSDNHQIVYSVTGVPGSDTTGIYLAQLPSGAVTRILSSGRDPVPWERSGDTIRILYEETNTVVGSGLFAYNPTSGYLQRMGLFGNSATLSFDGNAIGYLGGTNGSLPCYALSTDNWNEHIIPGMSAYHIQFLRGDTLCYDTYNAGVISINRYIINGNTNNPLLFENAGAPVTAPNGTIAFLYVSATSNELVIYRNYTLYHVANNVSSYCLTANGRVVYELSNDTWISD